MSQESLINDLRQRGAYEILWEIAKWMETELAESLIDKHLPVPAQKMRNGAEKIKEAARGLLC